MQDDEFERRKLGREAMIVADIEKERVTQTLANARGHPNNAILILIHISSRAQIGSLGPEHC
jgi:hypothetical protein